jgi:hypothetical protein
LLKEKPSSALLLFTTGHDYAEWFQLLDGWGAPGPAYRAIASAFPLVNYLPVAPRARA